MASTSSAPAMRRGWALAGLVAAALAAPSTAFAHVGRGPVVAVGDQARITRIRPSPAPFQVRVIDGDQGLWLRLDSGHELIVLGVIGEPLLRFGAGGVYVNKRSPTAQIDRIALTAVAPSFNPHAAPAWKKLTGGRSYRWHDHRLHALAPLGGEGAARRLGTWTIPLRLDGKPAALTGGLWYTPAPDLWLWLALPLLTLAGTFAVIRTRRERLIEHITMVLAATTAVCLVVARAGRELYGRPHPATVGYVSLAIGVALTVFVLDRLLVRPTDARWFIALVVGVVGLVDALTLLPTLYHGLVLAAVPAPLERTCVALVLGTGTATMLLCVFTGLGDSGRAREVTSARTRQARIRS